MLLQMSGTVFSSMQFPDGCDKTKRSVGQVLSKGTGVCGLQLWVQRH